MTILRGGDRNHDHSLEFFFFSRSISTRWTDASAASVLEYILSYFLFSFGQQVEGGNPCVSPGGSLVPRHPTAIRRVSEPISRRRANSQQPRRASKVRCCVSRAWQRDFWFRAALLTYSCSLLFVMMPRRSAASFHAVSFHSPRQILIQLIYLLLYA